MSFAEMTQNRARLRRKFDHQGEREPPAGAKKLGFEALLKGFLKGFRFKKCDFFSRLRRASHHPDGQICAAGAKKSGF